jgi:hypothetical protein
MTGPQFKSALDAGLHYLDGALPAWETFHIFTSVGFFLDQQNLDWACFDS